MSNKEDEKQIAIGAGLHELTQRHGEAGRQFLIGLQGFDPETGIKLDRSLYDIQNYKINPDYVEQNIKQQSGYSAEIASTAKKNADAIARGDKTRFARSEDVAGYGKNDSVVDIVKTDADGNIVTSQMKFVSDEKNLLKKIAEGNSGGKNDLSRYLDVDKLELPTEQIESAKKICQEQAKELDKQAQHAREQGDISLATKKQQQADNYRKLERKIEDSGLSSEEARRYRENPTQEIRKNILTNSHNAGIEGAKTGAAIGGAISVVSNMVAMASGDKEFSKAVLDISKDTAIAGAVGYGTGFVGAGLKTVMGQSNQAMIRQLAKTGLPAMIVSTCLSMKGSIMQYARGEIEGTELIQQMGITASGTLSASVFATIGQVAIPIPVLGSLIGGMIGYTLTNTFYTSFFSVLKDAKLAEERRIIVEMQCRAAILIARQYESAIKELFAQRITELQNESEMMFALLDNPNITDTEFCAGMNRFAEILGKKLTINSISELDNLMLSDDPLII